MAIFEHYAIKDYEIKIYNLVQPVLFARDTILYKNVEHRVLKFHTGFSQNVPFIGCNILFSQQMVISLS